MSLVPRPSSELRASTDLRRETVTVTLLDLYDLLMRAQRKDRAMPDLNNATTTKTTKRGYRRISMTLKLAEYEVIAKMAEAEDRTPDQQALHMLRRLIGELHVEAIKSAYREAEARRADDAEWEGDADPIKHDLDQDGVDPHGIELGSVTRTE